MQINNVLKLQMINPLLQLGNDLGELLDLSLSRIIRNIVVECDSVRLTCSLDLDDLTRYTDYCGVGGYVVKNNRIGTDT